MFYTHLPIVSHDIVESCQKSGTRRDLWMHSTIDIVEQVEGLRDQLVAITSQTLLNLLLTTRKHMVSIRRLK